MLKKISELNDTELAAISCHAWEMLEYDQGTYRIEVISSKEPIIKGRNIIYSSLQIYKYPDYHVEGNQPVYKEVFKETITKEQMEEAISSVRKFPNTYIPKAE